MPVFLLWTLEAANYQDFNNCPLSRLSPCLSCPALLHVCSHTLAQFSQWSCAKITHLCWTKQHIGLQAAKRLGIIHPKYRPHERCGPAMGFCVKIVNKVSETHTKKYIYPSVLVWYEKLTAPCKNESLDFSFTSFLNTMKYLWFVVFWGFTDHALRIIKGAYLLHYPTAETCFQVMIYLLRKVPLHH